jgi:protein involved in polysaccharide export with SLBB domain
VTARQSLGVLLALVLVGCTVPPRVLPAQPDLPPPQPLLATHYEYAIGVGDQLRVTVWQQPDLSTREQGAPVDGMGRVPLPYIGLLEVGGRTVPEATALVETRLALLLKEPHATVEVVKFGSQRFFVLGEVRDPGVYTMNAPTTAFEGLSLAKGFATYANREQVAWVHGGIDRENVVLFDGSQLDPAAMQLLSPGDVLFVGRRRWADTAEAARDLLPVLQAFAVPISIAVQLQTLEKVN